MKCPYCGKEVVEGSLFCDGCGAKLDSAPAVNPTPYTKYEAGPLNAYMSLIELLYLSGNMNEITAVTNAADVKIIAYNARTFFLFTSS